MCTGVRARTDEEGEAGGVAVAGGLLAPRQGVASHLIERVPCLAFWEDEQRLPRLLRVLPCQRECPLRPRRARDQLPSLRGTNDSARRSARTVRPTTQAT